MPTSRQAGPKSHGTPCAMVLRLLRALAGVPGLLASVACRSLDRLDPSVGGSRPRDLTVRIGHASSAQQWRPPHPAPRVVTIGRTSLVLGRGRWIKARVPFFVNSRPPAAE